MRPSLFLLALSLVFAPLGPAKAEVVSVPIADGADDPTQTFLWESPHPKAVLIMIPGGEGHIGLQPDKADLGGIYGRVFKPLSEPTLSSGNLHVVIFDSPYALPSDPVFPTSRISSDHQRRIESVVQFYRQRFGLPVWLQGHSNGAISVAEFIRTHRDMVAGAILSSSRVGAKVSADVGLPILFLHHRRDSCSKANPAADVEIYESLRSAGKTDVDFAWVEGGTAGRGDACHAGYHMFLGSEEDAYRAVDRFIAGR
ncbi:conserved protein of unknown function (alpha/beta-Hydrolases 1-255) [Magnetospirillum sp. XM-1]|uniref:alpha/beta hydrolase n=1 Tax=Magnetospirillum sp. XM-1 TaxID=1663591 RepID=UPI00073DFD24|nr:alpha/beta hydrolase [Magnetospirillum sp. XM-1]CUW41721.1 conserved protein of unknown function (alpha/beta-Hydrolases 1-255) [Magnetospirillum sp. XM-1]